MSAKTLTLSSAILLAAAALISGCDDKKTSSAPSPALKAVKDAVKVASPTSPKNAAEQLAEALEEVSKKRLAAVEKTVYVKTTIQTLERDKAPAEKHLADINREIEAMKKAYNTASGNVVNYNGEDFSKEIFKKLTLTKFSAQKSAQKNVAIRESEIGKYKLTQGGLQLFLAQLGNKEDELKMAIRDSARRTSMQSVNELLGELQVDYGKIVKDIEEPQGLPSDSTAESGTSLSSEEEKEFNSFINTK